MTYPLKQTDTITKALIGVSFKGDIIHPEWFSHIGRFRKPRKGTSPIFKPDLLAIAIYANIVFWYRPFEIRTEDEKTEYLKKYKGDYVQKSYKSYQDKWGVSREQVKSAVDLLVELNLVEREIRNRRWVFIKLNVTRFFEITQLPGKKEGLNNPTYVGINNPTYPPNEGLNNPPTDILDHKNINTKNRSSGVTVEDSFKTVTDHYQNKIEQLNPVLNTKLNTAIERYPESWLIEAIDIASKKGKRSWSYINGILNNWSSSGKQDNPPSSNGNHSLPDNLNTTMFQIAWDKWTQHMKEKGRSLTPTSTEASLQELSEWGEDRAIEAINFSVRKGWLSINEYEKQPPKQEDRPYKGYSPLGRE